MEGARRADRILTDHGVDDQKNIFGACTGTNIPKFAHQLLVDSQTTGGIKDDHVMAVGLCIVNPLGTEVGWAGASSMIDRDRQPFAQHLKLIHGRRSIHIRRYQ